MKKRKIPLLCRIGLHWPLNRKRVVVEGGQKGQSVYICQCNCGKYWLAFGRYSLTKVQSEGRCWLTALLEEEELEVNNEIEKE